MKKLITILILLIILLYIQLYSLINLNYISNENGFFKCSNNELELKNDYGRLQLPHINFKATVKKLENEIVEFQISDYANTYLLLNAIILKIKVDNKINIGDTVFIKLNNINIIDKKLIFENIEIYKEAEHIKYKTKETDTLLFMTAKYTIKKIKGKSFTYNNYQYFLADIPLGNSDDIIYYENIKNGNLLIECYKHILYPKIYNMINPQETRFEELVEIYKGAYNNET